ncbi:succinyl-diaminopimelate desuccinylase [Aquincola sp. S2]|uniref:Succinyl-diaminopimelate desuccinylase n=1 Tax=Pseudaquabacterium terrae TaxID=2732868 RepID=A0ABX2EJC6_9BURK|nr:succinyl-diaminopimelate desuccinylase [Aquabacterium terrae]NRF68751.1 succinyl-diaminopimelate desuccinylase [Aquabacterium terrae]
MSDTLRLLEALISRRSVTPDDAGCQALVTERLAPLGFECETLLRGPDDFRVTNLWATHRGARAGPTVVLAGHTDVVPTGPLSQWTSDPFVPSHRDGKLFGRGAADMKTSIAAMTVAAGEFVNAYPDHAGTLALLFTSDEEGPSVDGTVRVVEALQARGERLDCCIVGEPTSVETLGDTIKNGRRGTLSAKLTVRGIQGHVAYPQLARNPIHQLAPALAELATTVWDQGNEHFPPTTWQVSNIHGGTGALNVIPGEVVVDCNWRFSTESTPESLKSRFEATLRQHGLDYAVAWTLGGSPFLTRPGRLSEALSAAIRSETGVATELSTTGGTSDGRFIARICEQVVEFGPINASIHKIDENVNVGDIERLKNIYRRTLESLLT